MKKLVVMSIALLGAFSAQAMLYNPKTGKTTGIEHDALQRKITLGKGPVQVGGHDKVQSILLNTRGSTVVAEGETCHFIPSRRVGGGLMTNVMGRTPAQISCSDGTVFNAGQFEQKEGALTGTPPNIQFASTYIGSYTSQESTPGMAGSGKRIFFIKK